MAVGGFRAKKGAIICVDGVIADGFLEEGLAEEVNESMIVFSGGYTGGHGLGEPTKRKFGDVKGKIKSLYFKGDLSKRSEIQDFKCVRLITDVDLFGRNASSRKK